LSPNIEVSPSAVAGKSYESFVNNTPSHTISEFFKRNHRDKCCSILQKKIEPFRNQFRVLTLKTIPEFKPILDKITVGIAHAKSYCIIPAEFVLDEHFDCTLILYAGDKRIAQLDYWEDSMSHSQLYVYDDATTPLKLAKFEQRLHPFYSLSLVEGSPLFTTLQKLLNTLHLEESTSVVTFAKFLSLLGPTCVIPIHGTEMHIFEEEPTDSTGWDWDIFDDASYDAVEAKIVAKFDDNAIISKKRIKKIVSDIFCHRLFGTYFVRAAKERGLLEQQDSSGSEPTYKLIKKATDKPSTMSRKRAVESTHRTSSKHHKSK
jgi:hypothetical protein